LSDLTIDEFINIVRTTVRDVLEQERQPSDVEFSQVGLLALQPLSVGDWPSELKLISREEYYDDDR